MNNLITLFVFIYKFSLICWSNVKSAPISDNAVFRAVNISVYHVTDGDFMQLDLHSLTCFLRIVILA